MEEVVRTEVKKMLKLKKLIVLSAVVLASCAMLFAAETNYNPSTNKVYSALNEPFTKTSARLSAMGGAGVAVFSNQDSLYINPASLGEKGLVFNVPNVSFTLYNFDALGIDDFDKVSSLDALLDTVGGVIGTLSSVGRNKLLSVDAGAGFKAGRFAFAIDSQVTLNTYNKTGDIIGEESEALNAIPQVDVAATAGFGFRFFRDSSVNFDVGLSASLRMRAFMEAVNAEKLINSISDDSFDILFGNNPIVIGWAVPLTAAVNVNFPFGITIANVVSNIHLVNGGYNYKITGGYDEIKDDIMGTITDTFKGSEDFVAKSDPIWTLGFGWSPDFGGWNWIVRPTVAVDVVDVAGLVDDFNIEGILSRLKVGAELDFFKTFEIRAGLNAGYMSAGIGVNLFNVIHLEASYYWNEFGDRLGQKDVDALTIRMNIGWER